MLSYILHRRSKEGFLDSLTSKTSGDEIWMMSLKAQAQTSGKSSLEGLDSLDREVPE